MTKPSTDEPDQAWEEEQRAALAYELAQPSYDAQQQPDSTSRDAEAERRSDAALAGRFKTSAAPTMLRERVTLASDSLAWLRQTYPDWGDVLNTMLCHFHNRSLMIEVAFDPDGFESGELIADVPPELEPVF